MFTVPDELFLLLLRRLAACSCEPFAAGVDIAGDGLLAEVLSLRLIPTIVGVCSDIFWRLDETFQQLKRRYFFLKFHNFSEHSLSFYSI